MDEVTLRDVDEADLPILFPYQLDPEATAMAAFPSRDREAFMGHWAKIRVDETVVTKVIELDGDVVGDVVSWLDSGHRDVGYWIGKEYWGQGVATKALAQFLAHVEERSLYAHVAAHNRGSIRVLEKCGFTASDDDVESSATPEDDIEEVLMKLA
ncbi:MAG: GNAT family N-acetyltransferase [Actinomycetota bacterium]|nr:GNAT family N-acetyltransferase [Actinomycetota bacterium]